MFLAWFQSAWRKKKKKEGKYVPESKRVRNGGRPSSWGGRKKLKVARAITNREVSPISNEKGGDPNGRDKEGGLKVGQNGNLEPRL